MSTRASGYSLQREKEHRKGRWLGFQNTLDEIDKFCDFLGAQGLSEIDSDHEDDSVEQEAKPFSQVDYGRRIEVPLDVGLDYEGLEMLNDVCAAESEYIEEMQGLVFGSLFPQPGEMQEDALWDTVLTAPERLRVFQLGAERVHKTTDDVVDNFGLAKPVQLGRHTRAVWPVWVQSLLEEFSEVCDRPNLLEVRFFAQMFGCTPRDVEQWFSHRITETKDRKDMLARLSAKRKLYSDKISEAKKPSTTQAEAQADDVPVNWTMLLHAMRA